MVSIPADCWRHVAHSLPRKDLQGLFMLNSALFHLAMNERYREIYFLWFDDRTMKRMQRLRDPAVSYRVRTLHVESWFGEKNADSYLARNNMISSTSNPDYEASVDAVVQKMVDIITCLPNVTEFTIGCTVLPYQKHLSRFFAAAWKTFRLALRKVTLRARPEDFPTLLYAAKGLDVLEDLMVEFKENNTSAGQNGTRVLTLTLVRFVNDVAPTLRSLSLSSRKSTPKLSSLLRSLPDIPNLERLDIDINLNSDGLSGLGGFVSFLRTHAPTLRHVRWRNHITTIWDLTLSRWISRDPLPDWLEENRGDKSILSNLCSLGIQVPGTTGGFDLIVEYLVRSADTMTSLSLWGYHLNYDEVQTVTSIFGHRQEGKHFEKLSLAVKHLSVELMLHLAQSLPHLKTLNLHIHSISGPTQGLGNIHETLRVKEQQMSNAREFAAQMKEQDIRGWSLRDITISINHGAVDNLGRKLMHLLAECVPSIQICYGMDKCEVLDRLEDPL